MAGGLRPVGRPMAVEGRELVPGEHVLVAADAVGFADHVVALLDDGAVWCTLSAAGASAITDRFGPEVARAALQDLLDTAAKGAHPEP